MHPARLIKFWNLSVIPLSLLLPVLMNLQKLIRVGESETVPILKFLSGNNRLNIWPEWDDASLANEKWDVPAKGKSDRAARTPGTVRKTECWKFLFHFLTHLQFQLLLFKLLPWSTSHISNTLPKLTLQLFQLFEDPEGLVILPASLKVESWRRPGDYLGDKVNCCLKIVWEFHSEI